MPNPPDLTPLSPEEMIPILKDINLEAIHLKDKTSAFNLIRSGMEHLQSNYKLTSESLIADAKKSFWFNPRTGHMNSLGAITATGVIAGIGAMQARGLHPDITLFLNVSYFFQNDTSNRASYHTVVPACDFPPTELIPIRSIDTLRVPVLSITRIVAVD